MTIKKMDDDKLDSVVGGKNAASVPTKICYCPKCKTDREFKLYSGGRAFCSKCNEEILL